MVSLAIASGNTALVEYLLDLGQNQNEEMPKEKDILGGMSYIATASAYGFLDIARLLLDRFPDTINKPVPKTGIKSSIRALNYILLMSCSVPVLRNGRFDI